MYYIVGLYVRSNKVTKQYQYPACTVAGVVCGIVVALTLAGGVI